MPRMRNCPSPASYYMHLPGQRASRCPKRATCSGVRSLQFLWVLPGTHYVHALIWPRFHGALH